MKVIITGTTGMVGEGVMHIALNDPKVEEVLSISRKSTGVSHPKLKELIHKDFFDFSGKQEELSGYDTCLFCLGVSSVGMDADEYFEKTYTLTLALAKPLSEVNPQMTFCYISGAGTDSSEEGKSRWARVKGKTENDLMKLPFKQVFGVRPGFIKALPEMKHTQKLYKFFGWMYWPGRLIFPSAFCRLDELGNAMLEVSENGFEKKILDGKAIIELAKRREAKQLK